MAQFEQGVWCVMRLLNWLSDNTLGRVTLPGFPKTRRAYRAVCSVKIPGPVNWLFDTAPAVRASAAVAGVAAVALGFSAMPQVPPVVHHQRAHPVVVTVAARVRHVQAMMDGWSEFSRVHAATLDVRGIRLSDAKGVADIPGRARLHAD